MSVIRPALCEAIAARISGAPAMRSTSICACSLSRNCARSAPRRPRRAAGSRAARSRHCATPRSRHGSRSRARARAVPQGSGARTIASSAAWLSARSAPVARATRPAPLAPADSSRDTGAWPAPAGAEAAPFSRSAMARSCTDPTGRTTGATTDQGSVGDTHDELTDAGKRSSAVTVAQITRTWLSDAKLHASRRPAGNAWSSSSAYVVRLRPTSIVPHSTEAGLGTRIDHG